MCNQIVKTIKIMNIYITQNFLVYNPFQSYHKMQNDIGYL